MSRKMTFALILAFLAGIGFMALVNKNDDDSVSIKTLSGGTLDQNGNYTPPLDRNGHGSKEDCARWRERLSSFWKHANPPNGDLMEKVIADAIKTGVGARNWVTYCGVYYPDEAREFADYQKDPTALPSFLMK